MILLFVYLHWFHILHTTVELFTEAREMADPGQDANINMNTGGTVTRNTV